MGSGGCFKASGVWDLGRIRNWISLMKRPSLCSCNSTSRSVTALTSAMAGLSVSRLKMRYSSLAVRSEDG
jgi:hypothetical protein